MSIRTAIVLIIDDSEVQRSMCIRAIQNALAPGVSTVASSGVRNVTDLVSWGEVDVVVLDMVLEEGEPQGYDAIMAVRDHCAAPIIVYSGILHGDDLKRIRMLARIGGVIDYVEKRDSMDKLLEAVVTAIGTRRQSQSEQHEVRAEVRNTMAIVEEQSKTQTEMLAELRNHDNRIGTLETTVDGGSDTPGLKSHCQRRTKLINKVAWALFIAIIGGAAVAIFAN